MTEWFRRKSQNKKQIHQHKYIVLHNTDSLRGCMSAACDAGVDVACRCGEMQARLQRS